MKYSANVTSVFLWVVTYDIRVGSVTSCGLKDTTHKVGPNEDVMNLSRRDCDDPISPYLFLLCVERLSAMFKKEERGERGLQ